MPTNLQLTLISAGQVDLSWTDGGGTIDFEIQRAEGSSGFAKINTLSAGKTTYSDNTVQQGKTYSYRINAINAGGSTLSEVKMITIPTAPAAPELTLQVLSSTEIRVDFKNPAGANAITLELQYALDQNFTNGLAGQNVAVAGGSVTIGSRQPNTRYYFRLRASNSVSKLASDWVLKDATTLPPPVTKPNPPTNFVATVKTATLVDLSWTDGGGGANEFEIQRAEGAGAFAKINTLAATKLSTQDNAVQQGKTYSYRINAINAGGNALSDVKTVTMPTAPPQADYALTVLSSSQIRVDAKGSSGATTLELQYARDDKFTVGLGGQNLPAAGGSVTISDLPASTRHYFRLRATNATYSLASDWLVKEATTASVTIVKPNAPTSFVAVVKSATQVELSWANGGGGAIGGYNVQRGDGSGGFSDIAKDLTTTTYTDNSVQGGRTYTYKIYAYNGGGGSFSENKTVTTPVTKPNAPTDLKLIVDGSGTFITAIWTDNADNETDFEFQYADNANYTNAVSSRWQRNSPQAILPGLTPCKTYWMRVAATNGAGNSGWAEAKTAANPTAPNVPNTLAGNAVSASQINLTWAYTTSTEQNFELEYADNETYTDSTKRDLAKTNRAEPITGLRASTVYSIRLRARNCATVSDWTSTKTITSAAPAVKPNAPGNLVLTPAADGRQLTLTWTDNADNESRFDIQYADNATYTNPTSVSVGAEVKTFTISSLTPCITYFVRVSAANVVGSSAWVEANAAARPNVPGKVTGLSSSTVSPTQLTLTWAYATTTEEALELEYADNAIYTGSTRRDLPKTTVSESLTGLRGNTAYNIRLRAKNCAAGGEWAETTARTPTDPTPVLPTPTNLRFATASPVFNELSLLWASAATTETGCEIWRSPTDQANWTRLAELPAKTTTHTDRNLRTGTLYHYRVRTMQGSTASEWSNVVSDRPPLVNATALPAEVRVFPNPTTDRLTIKGLGLEGVVQVQVCALNGQELITQTAESTGGAVQIHLADLPAGLYVLRLSAETVRFSNLILKH